MNKIILIVWFAIAGMIQLKANTADSLYQSGNWKSAIAAYEEYLKFNPTDRPGFQWNRIGQSYFNLQEWAQAIEAFKKSVGYNNNSTVMYNMACAFARLSQKDSSLAWLDRAADAGFTKYEDMAKDEDLRAVSDDARFQPIVNKVKKNAEPCAFQPESRQFDFWVGHWKVFNPQGQRAGTSDIEKILGECVIQENWTDFFGNKGKSFNFYNTSDKKWQQTWVDDKGSVTEFIEGIYENGAMRFQSSRSAVNPQDGKIILRRLTFFNVSAIEVRQLGERSDDEGKSWVIEYDLKYTRE